MAITCATGPRFSFGRIKNTYSNLFCAEFLEESQQVELEEGFIDNNAR